MSLLDSVLPPPGGRMELRHPDGRRRCFRFVFDDATEESVDKMVEALNDANGGVHAASWDAHHRERDDAEVRTLLLKPGFLPPLSLLQAVDPAVTVSAWVHGCLRLRSRVSTDDWISKLGTLNEGSQQRKKHKNFTPSQHIFQAIRDGKGLHWICQRAVASSPRMRGWPAASQNGFTPSQSAYQVVRGVSIFWPTKSVRAALNKLGVSDPGPEFRWARIFGEKEPMLVVPSYYSIPATSATLNRFISLNVTSLPASTPLQIQRQAFNPSSTFDLNRVSQAVAEAKQQ